LLKNPKFATESTQASPRELTISKNFKFRTPEFTKIRHFEITKQKLAPSQTRPPVGRGVVPGGERTPLPTLHPFGASSPQL